MHFKSNSYRLCFSCFHLKKRPTLIHIKIFQAKYFSGEQSMLQAYKCELLVVPSDWNTWNISYSSELSGSWYLTSIIPDSVSVLLFYSGIIYISLWTRDVSHLLFKYLWWISQMTLITLFSSMTSSFQQVCLWGISPVSPVKQISSKSSFIASFYRTTVTQV